VNRIGKGYGMNTGSELFTATMARVYASQGHFEKAAGIYRKLVAASPERKDLSEALAEVEQSLAGGKKDSKTLLLLLNRWVELSLAYRRWKAVSRLGLRVRARLTRFQE
jgi:hypothetical protein